jgi:hypothetical protein
MTLAYAFQCFEANLNVSLADLSIFFLLYVKYIMTKYVSDIRFIEFCGLKAVFISVLKMCIQPLCMYVENILKYIY